MNAFFSFSILGPTPTEKVLVLCKLTLKKVTKKKPSLSEYYKHFNADSEGIVPLWEAILGKHDAVIKVLRDNGATLSSGDIGHFACYAAEQNSVGLLQEIIKYEGDITQPDSHGTTSLHKAISQGNVEICKFLIDQGADPDAPDEDGWTPRALADHQGNGEIKALLETRPQSSDHKRHQVVKTGASSSSQPHPQKRAEGSRSSEMDSAKTGTRQTQLQSSLAGIITAGQRQGNEC